MALASVALFFYKKNSDKPPGATRPTLADTETSSKKTPANAAGADNNAEKPAEAEKEATDIAPEKKEIQSETVKDSDANASPAKSNKSPPKDKK